MNERATRWSPVAPWRRRLLPGAVALVLAGAVPMTVMAQEEPDGLAERVREHFRVLPLTDGLLLEPLDTDLGVSTVEIREDHLAIDGEPLAAEAVAVHLAGEAGELVVALSQLSGEERTALFAPPAPAPEPAPEPPAAADPQPEAAPAPPAPPPPHPPTGRADDRVAFGSSLHVTRGERAKDVVVFGGPLTMEGEAFGDVVCIGGPATVDGPVHGDVVSVAGPLTLGPHAHISGQLIKVAGPINRHPDSVVEGGVEVSPIGFDWREYLHGRDAEDAVDHAESFSPFGRVVKKTFFEVATLLLITLLAMLVVLFARGPLERTAERMRREPAKSGLVGLGVEILILPVTVAVVVLLAVSIIGIPLILLVPFALLGAVLVAFFGYCAALYRIGDWVQGRFSWNLSSPFVIVLLGSAILGSLGVVGALLHFGWLNVFAALLIALGVLATYLAWTIGLGAALLQWLDSRRGPAAPAAPPAPEPAALGGPLEGS